MESIIYFLFLIFISSALTENPIVSIHNGVIKGTWQVSTAGRRYASFRGVPYAQPPMGKNRFRNPQALKPWSGIWDATEFQSSCLQYNYISKGISGSEDCLFLNVYSPRVSSSAHLPVVIFIHGGAFMYGSSKNYDPSHLMEKNLVQVTINYRLGPLGFLSTGDTVASGNFGLKDQAMAIKWVHDNIWAFGGNPNSITLTGNSAGAASVHYHMMSAWSKGFFHKAILHSGSALCPWTFTMKAAEKAKTLAANVGCPTDDSVDLVHCLRTRPAESIVRAQIPMFTWKVHLFSHFVPTMEPVNSERPFLTKHPYQATLDGDLTEIPLVASITSEEGLYPAAAYQQTPDLLPELESKWYDLASNIFEYNDTLPVSKHREVAERIKDHYLDNEDVGNETFSDLVQALGDRHFSAGIGKFVQLYALKAPKPIFMYRFSFRGAFSLSNKLANNYVNYGTCHADDVHHIFKESLTSQADDEMSKVMVDMVYSFAASGTPRLKDGIEWLRSVIPFNSMLTYIDIQSPDSFTMKSSSDFGQQSFWDNLGFEENEYFKREY